MDLLHRHGLPGRLGDTQVGVPQQRPAPDETDAGPGQDHNVLGMSWSDSVALDVCALVCQGSRVLSDDHLVFFNNPRTPEGSVRSVTATAVDPVTNPEADLSGFTDAFIRLLGPLGEELGRLEVSDGRRGETALVLGSSGQGCHPRGLRGPAGDGRPACPGRGLRRRASGDWDFVIGGKGYPGGLEALVQEHGIEVS